MSLTLVILILLCFVFAFLFLKQEARQKYVPAVILKGLASLCFVLIGISCFQGSAVSKLVLAGLVLGAIADVLLNLRWVFSEQGQEIFLVGIVVFLGGHILYLSAIAPLVESSLLCVICGILLTALLMIWIFKRITAKKTFKIFGVIYIGAIVLLNCFAVGNLFSAVSLDAKVFSWLFAAGAVFFLVSDVVLILNTFGTNTRQSLRNLNIGLYYIGQILIALSLLFTGGL